jgi:hypothetical protein
VTTTSTSADAPWRAPVVERPDGSLVAREPELLAGLLDHHRTTLLAICSGLTGEQLAIRAVDPSGISLLGLLRHLRKVERVWWRQRVGGQDVAPLHGFGEGVDRDFDELDPEGAADDYAALLDEWREADAVAAVHDLEEVVHSGAEPFSVRFVYLHLIGEYARHNGHADLVRERVDGATGF